MIEAQQTGEVQVVQPEQVWFDSAPLDDDMSRQVDQMVATINMVLDNVGYNGALMASPLDMLVVPQSEQLLSLPPVPKSKLPIHYVLYALLGTGGNSMEVHSMLPSGSEYLKVRELPSALMPENNGKVKLRFRVNGDAPVLVVRYAMSIDYAIEAQRQEQSLYA